MSAKKCHFNPEWQSSSDFKNWLLPSSKSSNEAYCKLCQKTFSLSNMGLSAVKNHLKGDKHIKMMGHQKSNILQFMTPSSTSSSTKSLATVSSDAPVTTPTFSSPNDQQVIKKSDLAPYIMKDEVTRAEVQWCMFSVKNNLSNRTAAAAVDLFKVMLSNDDVVNQMKLGRDKVAYTIVHGIAPYIKKELDCSVTKQPFFVVCFDESLNKVSQRGQMDVHLRFWQDNKVVTRFYTSEFLGHATADNLVFAFNSALQSLDMTKVLQIGLDGPNVNLKALRLIQEDLSQTSESKILDIGTCSLHVVDGALRAGDKEGHTIMSFLRSCYYVFKDLPSRRADYLRFSNNDNAKLPPKFCSTRWVENATVATRCLEILPYLHAYVSGISKEKREPDSQSYKTMKQMLSDPLLPAKLSFFVSVVGDMEWFLKMFQTDSPMLPFLYEQLEILLNTLMKRVVKPSILEEYGSGFQRAKLILDGNHLLDPSQIAIGYGAKTAIKGVKSSKEQILQFMKQCRQFLVTVLKKLQIRCPLRHKFVRGCASLDPAIMSLSDNTERTKLLDDSLTYLVETKWLEGTEADRVKSQYDAICSRPTFKEQCIAFNKASDRLDIFFCSLVFESSDTKDLQKFIRMVLCLSHGQASVERGFSLNKDLLVENQKEESLIAQRLCKDYLHYQNDGKHFQYNTFSLI